jgi:hypothetical protein
LSAGTAGRRSKEEVWMEKPVLQKIQAAMSDWTPPAIPAQIPQGDMPGDKVKIVQAHIDKTNALFPQLLPLLAEALEEKGRAVISVCGGSGVGKSGVASLLTYYLGQIGVGSYTMSGDNYPRRIPQYNDAERLSLFRTAGVRGMLTSGVYDPERAAVLKELQAAGTDADPGLVEEYPWLAVYQREGRARLSAYLGSSEEQDFDEVTGIISQFKNGADAIWLKRMGRTDTELWYDKVDFSGKSVLIIEWTHGNSRHFQGADIPILLNSTPSETAEYRRLRGRDGNTDSPFTTMVLEIEQKLLESQADRAKLILSKQGEILSYRAYRQRMALE